MNTSQFQFLLSRVRVAVTDKTRAQQVSGLVVLGALGPP